MAQEMEIQATLAGGMRFDIETGSGHKLTLDAGEDLGGVNSGARPMEMLLTGLAGCMGMSIISILNKMHQEVLNYKINIHGERASKHPQVFTTITVEHILRGPGLKSEAVQRAFELAERKYCGASTMLENAATIKHAFRIQEA